MEMLNVSSFMNGNSDLSAKIPVQTILKNRKSLRSYQKVKVEEVINWCSSCSWLWRIFTDVNRFFWNGKLFINLWCANKFWEKGVQNTNKVDLFIVKIITFIHLAIQPIYLIEFKWKSNTHTVHMAEVPWPKSKIFARRRRNKTFPSYNWNWVRILEWYIQYRLHIFWSTVLFHAYCFDRIGYFIDFWMLRIVVAVWSLCVCVRGDKQQSQNDIWYSQGCVAKSSGTNHGHLIQLQINYKRSLVREKKTLILNWFALLNGWLLSYWLYLL